MGEMSEHTFTTGLGKTRQRKRDLNLLASGYRLASCTMGGSKLTIVLKRHRMLEEGTYPKGANSRARPARSTAPATPDAESTTPAGEVVEGGPAKPNSLAKFAGIFDNDPHWADVEAAIARNREIDEGG